MEKAESLGLGLVLVDIGLGEGMKSVVLQTATMDWRREFL